MECFPFLRLAALIPLTQLAFCWNSLLSDRESLRSKKGTGEYSPLSSSFFFLRYWASFFVSRPSSSQPLGRENQTHKLLVHLTGEKNWQTPLVQLSIPFMPCTHFIFVQVFFTSAEIRHETRQWDGCQEDVRAPMQHTFFVCIKTARATCCVGFLMKIGFLMKFPQLSLQCVVAADIWWMEGYSSKSSHVAMWCSTDLWHQDCLTIRHGLAAVADFVWAPAVAACFVAFYLWIRFSNHFCLWSFARLLCHSHATSQWRQRQRQLAAASCAVVFGFI